MLTQAKLKELLSYNKDTGRFQWRVGRRIGKIAGARQSQGYIQIEIDGRAYYAHCLAWLYVYGELLQRELDHINLVKDDNRIVNLRKATPKQNSQNRALRIDNALGTKGVHRRENGRFRASIRIDGKLINLGTYQTIELAADAYAAAVKKYHGEFARLS